MPALRRRDRPRGDARARPAGAIGACRIECVAQAPGNPAGREQRIEQQRPIAARPLDIGGQTLVDELAKGLPVRRAEASAPLPSRGRRRRSAGRSPSPRAPPRRDPRRRSIGPSPCRCRPRISAMTIAGRPNRSLSRPATIPITPWCQPLLMTVITAAPLSSAPWPPPVRTPASRSRGVLRSAGRARRRSAALLRDRWR